MQETTKQMRPLVRHDPQQRDLQSSVGTALEINSLIIIKFIPQGYANTLWLCMLSRATQTAIIAHLHHSTRILHNSQYPNTPHFFTYHLRTGWALCRKHKNAWFERVSPQSQKAILSDHLSMKTLSPTAETWWGICPEGHKGPWRLAHLTPLLLDVSASPQHGEAGGRQKHCAQMTRLLPVTFASSCCPPPPPSIPPCTFFSIQASCVLAALLSAPAGNLYTNHCIISSLH